MTTLERLVALVVKQRTTIDPATVTTVTELSQLLGGHWSDKVPLLLSIENEFGIDLDAEATHSQTVGHLLSFLQRALNEPLDEPNGGAPFEELQTETEELLYLLKNRWPGVGEWQKAVRERIERLHELGLAAFGEPIEATSPL